MMYGLFQSVRGFFFSSRNFVVCGFFFFKFLFVLPGGHQGAHFRRSLKTNEEELVEEEHSVEAAASARGRGGLVKTSAVGGSSLFNTAP